MREQAASGGSGMARGGAGGMAPVRPVATVEEKKERFTVNPLASLYVITERSTSPLLGFN